SNHTIQSISLQQRSQISWHEVMTYGKHIIINPCIAHRVKYPKMLMSVYSHFLVLSSEYYVLSNLCSCFFILLSLALRPSDNLLTRFTQIICTKFYHIPLL